METVTDFIFLGSKIIADGDCSHEGALVAWKESYGQPREHIKKQRHDWGGLTNTCEKKRSKKQRRKGKIFPFECRVSKNSKEMQSKGLSSLLQHHSSKASLFRHSAFFSDQCKEIEENTRNEKTRDLFKKIRDTKGTFHAKMGSIKDRNGMDLTEAEDIKKRWQEYAEELYKKDLHDPDNHDGVITHLEPDILECEVKWALESITMNKASGGDRIPVELF